jgi:hypothetical protein
VDVADIGYLEGPLGQAPDESSLVSHMMSREYGTAAAARLVGMYDGTPTSAARQQVLLAGRAAIAPAGSSSGGSRAGTSTGRGDDNSSSPRPGPSSPSTSGGRACGDLGVGHKEMAGIVSEC